MSHAEHARITARRGESPTPQATPQKPGPLRIILENFLSVDAALENHRDRIIDHRDRIAALEAAAQTRATRAIVGYRVEADGRFVLTLPNGVEEAAGYLAKGVAE